MKQKTQNIENNEATVIASSQMGHDLKNAVLIVSLFLNLVVFVAWVMLQVTSQYDAQMASLLFG